MTIDECLEFADEWSRGITLHEGSQGWRVVCMLLAEEVRRQRKLLGGEDDISQSLVDQHELTLGIIAAAKNLVAVKGRHHTQIAYERLAVALKELEK